MTGDRRRNVLGFCQLILWIFGVIAQPGDVQVVIARGDLLSREAFPASLLALGSTLRLSERIFSEGPLKAFKIRHDEWSCFTESCHIRAHVIDPNSLRVSPVSLTAREKYNVGLDTLRIKDPRG